VLKQPALLVVRVRCCSDAVEECVVDDVRHQVIGLVVVVALLTILAHQLSYEGISGGTSSGPLYMNSSSNLVYVCVIEKNMLILVVQQTLVRLVLCIDLVVFPVLFVVFKSHSSQGTTRLDLITEPTDLVIMCPLGCLRLEVIKKTTRQIETKY